MKKDTNRLPQNHAKSVLASIFLGDGMQTLVSSLLCILGGLIVGYLVLLLIEPKGAFEAITAVMKSFFRFTGKARMKYFGQNLVRTVPLILCSLSVLFAYKVGMFNIGVAGQYVAGACGSLYAALAWKLPWLHSSISSREVVWANRGAMFRDWP